MTSSAKPVDRLPISSAAMARAMCGRRSILGLALASAFAFIGSAVAPASLAAAETVRVGIVGGEDEDVWKVVAQQAAKSGLTIKTVVFNDYTQPNEALERGDVEANAFQHKPYLDNQIKTRGYHIVPVGFTAVWPIGLYSHRHHSVAELPKGAIIGVPNDPSNEGRALIVLQSVGLIKLRDGSGILATTADIVANPKDVKIKNSTPAWSAVPSTTWTPPWSTPTGRSSQASSQIPIASPRSLWPTTPIATSLPSRPATRTMPGSRRWSPPTRTTR